MVPVGQLGQVKNLLEQDQIPHWVDSDAISIDGEPEIAVINLDQDIDVSALQQLLDNAG